MTANYIKYPEIQDVVVLLSGGLDSVTALYLAVKEFSGVRAVSFDYGSKHNRCELPLAEHHCRLLGLKHKIMPLDAIGSHFASDLLRTGGEIPNGHYQEDSMKRTVVPFRNGIMLAVAAGYAESVKAEGVVIAAHTGDHAIYPDCREDFMAAMGDAMTSGTYAGVRLLRPFIHLSKAEIVTLGHNLNVDYSATWSCYKGGDIHCGRCGTCTERREAFAAAGVTDPTVYAETPSTVSRTGKKSSR